MSVFQLIVLLFETKYFQHNVVKVVSNYSAIASLICNYFDNVMTKFINNRTDA